MIGVPVGAMMSLPWWMWRGVPGMSRMSPKLSEIATGPSTGHRCSGSDSIHSASPVRFDLRSRDARAGRADQFALLGAQVLDPLDLALAVDARTRPVADVSGPGGVAKTRLGEPDALVQPHTAQASGLLQLLDALLADRASGAGRRPRMIPRWRPRPARRSPSFLSLRSPSGVPYGSASDRSPSPLDVLLRYRQGGRRALSDPGENYVVISA